LSGSFFGQSSFARHAVVEERSLIRVDQNVQLSALAPLGCAIQTGVGTVVNVLKPEPQDSLVVFGAGAVGLAAVMGAAILGVKKIVVIDKIKSRLDIAVKCGATHAVEAGDTRALREAVGDTGFDFAIEATGNTKVLDQAIAGLASGGTCAVVGAPAAGSTISVDVKHLMRGRKIVGITEGDSNPYEFIPWLIGRHLEGKLPIELLVTEYKFEDIEQAALDALSGAVIKPVIVY
jgi:aryl-alcohol dehydrogenase